MKVEIEGLKLEPKMPRITHNQHQLGRGKKRFLPETFRDNMTRLTSGFQNFWSPELLEINKYLLF